MSKLDDAIIGVRCQACGKPVQVRLSRIKPTIRCSKCGTSFSVDPERLRDAASAAEQRFAAVWASDRHVSDTAVGSG